MAELLCIVCGDTPATCLCDMPIAKGKVCVPSPMGPRRRTETCDAPMCEHCAQLNGHRPWCTHHQLDYCPEHMGGRSDCEQGRHDLSVTLSAEQVAELRRSIHAEMVAGQQQVRRRYGR